MSLKSRRGLTFWEAAVYVACCLGGLFAFGLAGVSLLSRIQSLYALKAEGKDATAVVSAVRCSEHERIDYNFYIDGKLVTSSSNECSFRCESVKLGDKVTIKYNSAQVALTECGNIDKKIEGSVILGYCLIMAFAIASIAIIFMPWGFWFSNRKLPIDTNQ